MTYRTALPALSAIRVASSALLLVATLALTGCGSTQMQDGVTAQNALDGPVDTGTYPNMNIPPRSAAAPFTEAEKTAKFAELRSRQESQASQQVKPEASEAQLKALAKNHAKNTLNVIEGRCKAIDPACE